VEREVHGLAGSRKQRSIDGDLIGRAGAIAEARHVSVDSDPAGLDERFRLPTRGHAALGQQFLQAFSHATSFLPSPWYLAL
jgi:hypothetical protein